MMKIKLATAYCALLISSFPIVGVRCARWVGAGAAAAAAFITNHPNSPKNHDNNWHLKFSSLVETTTTGHPAAAGPRVTQNQNPAFDWAFDVYSFLQHENRVQKIGTSSRKKPQLPGSVNKNEFDWVWNIYSFLNIYENRVQQRNKNIPVSSSHKMIEPAAAVAAARPTKQMKTPELDVKITGPGLTEELDGENPSESLRATTTRAEPKVSTSKTSEETSQVPAL